LSTRGETSSETYEVLTRAFGGYAIDRT